ncbi:T9SS type A sorting domain-containing protein [Flavobacterium sp. TMP13]|uniref:T9SS type A sorting domain-containing protein n=1 Tax=Flavobacterium sp. TMP13 TaxID=3425950 RepID=UPI003D777C30
MKKTTLFYLLLASSSCFSQINFRSSALMYVKDEILFVKQYVDLGEGSNLYLRNNGQLIQGSETASVNSGSGELSVYQEGTSDNYDFNYWCSPVGIASATPGNGNFGVSMLSRPTTTIFSTSAILIDGLENLDGVSSPLKISTYWINKLVAGTEYSSWVSVEGATSILPGEGFTMKGTSGTDTTNPDTSTINNPGSAQRYDFRGRPNDGNISFSLIQDNLLLTGNPYPSALDLNAFLNENVTVTGGIAYFWDQDVTIDSHYLEDYSGGYGSYAAGSLGSDGIYTPATFKSYNADGSVNPGTEVTSIIYPRKYAPIGQGFVLNAVTSGTVTFKNSHRIYIKEGSGLGNSQFHKPAVKEDKTKKTAIAEDTVNEMSYFRVNTIINNQFTRQIALAFLPTATDEVDFGIDALNMDSELPNDVTFWLADDSFVIQGVNFDATKKIPLLVRATTNSTFKFSIPESVNFDPNQMVYLYDNATGTYHNIKTDSYLLNIPAGVYTDRFTLTFSNSTLGTTENTQQQLVIYQDNYNRSLKVTNPNAIDLQSFQLYDLTGKRLLSKTKLGSDTNFEFSTSAYSDGVYIVEFLTTNNEKITQKILISKSTKK